MDQNQIPSSPLQHHRPSSSQSNQAAKTTNEKLALDPNPRCTTSPVDSTLQQWPGQPSQTSAYPTPQSSTFSEWPNTGPQASASSSSSSSSTHPDHSQSQWESQVSSDQTMADPDHVPTPRPPMIDIPPMTCPTSSSSTLLTSEPLNRSTSSNVDVSLISPERTPAASRSSSPSAAGSSSSQVYRKRQRSLSLPAILSPPVKKRKSFHTFTPPLDSAAFLLAKSASSLSLNPKLTGRCTSNPVSVPLTPSSSNSAPRPSAIASSSKVHTQPTQVLVASRHPPVTTSSLRSLDAREILRNPQLRHDLLFDSLAFRPIVAPALVDPNRRESSKNLKRATDARTKEIVADMYWETVAEEIKTGCRCVRWRIDNGGEVNLDPAGVDTKKREKHCLCGKWRPGFAEEQWWEWQHARWSSRLPELVKTLRELLVSLMGSTTSCPDPINHALTNPDPALAHESCPTITHALVPELYMALDPEFLTIQVRRGVFNLNIFAMIGEAMKVHCAPIRDGMIEDMVRTAIEGDVTKALRKCFACAEVMKLDIANHQVHTLRPHLWKTAVKDELLAFNHHLKSSKSELLSSQTQKWIRSASLRVLAQTSPAERKSLMSSRTDLVFRSLAEGFMDLVFSDYSSATPSSVWPPVVQSRLHGAASVQLAEGTETGNVVLPESFKMDSRRFKNFHADVVDCTIVHLVLNVSRKSLNHAYPNMLESDAHSVIVDARKDLESVIMENGGVMRVSPPSEDPVEVSPLSLKIITRMFSPRSSTEGIKGGQPTVHSSKKLKKIYHHAKQLDLYFYKAVQKDSKVFTEAMERVRRALTLLLTHSLLLDRVDPASEHYTPPAPSISGSDQPSSSFSSRATAAPGPTVRNPGLVARERLARVKAQYRDSELALLKQLSLNDMDEELQVIVRNMKRIVGFNLQCFAGIYGERGMVVG